MRPFVCGMFKKVRATRASVGRVGLTVARREVHEGPSSAFRTRKCGTVQSGRYHHCQRLVGRLHVSCPPQSSRVWKRFRLHTPPTKSTLGHGNGTVPQNSRRRRQYSGVRFSPFGVLSAEKLTVASAHAPRRSNVFFSPNSKFVFASTLDSTIRLWDYQNDKTLKTYTGQTNRKCV